MSLYFWKQSQLSFLIIATFKDNLPFLALAIFKIFLLDFVSGFTMMLPCTRLFVVIPFLTHRDPWIYSLILCCTFSAIIPSDLVDALFLPSTENPAAFKLELFIMFPMCFYIFHHFIPPVFLDNVCWPIFWFKILSLTAYKLMFNPPIKGFS